MSLQLSQQADSIKRNNLSLTLEYDHSMNMSHEFLIEELKKVQERNQFLQFELEHFRAQNRRLEKELTIYEKNHRLHTHDLQYQKTVRDHYFKSSWFYQQNFSKCKEYVSQLMSIIKQIQIQFVQLKSKSQQQCSIQSNANLMDQNELESTLQDLFKKCDIILAEDFDGVAPAKEDFQDASYEQKIQYPLLFNNPKAIYSSQKSLLDSLSDTIKQTPKMESLDRSDMTKNDLTVLENMLNQSFEANQNILNFSQRLQKPLDPIAIARIVQSLPLEVRQCMFNTFKNSNKFKKIKLI